MAMYEVELEDGSIYEVETEDTSSGFKLEPQGYIPSQDPTEQRGAIPLMGMLSGGAVKAALDPTVPLAEAIGETTQIPEKIRSPLSGLVGIAPEALGAKALLKAGLKAAPAIGSGGRKLASAIFKKSPKKIPTGTLGDSAAIADEVVQMPVQQEKDLQKLESLRRSFGDKISEARAQAGIPQGRMSELPVPEDVTAFADDMKLISQKSPNNLLKAYGKDGLAELKDTVQLLRDSGKIEEGTRISAEINMAVNKIDDALAMVSPELEESLQGYRLAKSQMEEAPDYYKQLARERRSDLATAKTAEKKGATRRMLIQTLKKALPWIGGGAVAKFM